MEKDVFQINVQGGGEGQGEVQEDAEIKEIKTGPVTLAEVREVVGDPFSTNAGRVREILGRGSLSTIQKHLQVLREKLQKEREVKTDDAPEAPEIVINSLWVHAWHAAEAQVRSRMEQIVTERDHYKAAAEANTADAAVMAEAVDQAREQAEAQAQEWEQAKIKAEADAQAKALAWDEEKRQAEEREKELNAQIDAFKFEHEKYLKQEQGLAKEREEGLLKQINDLKHAAELAQRDRALERQTLQVEIDRMTNQLSQVQALLWKERERTEQPFPTPEPEQKASAKSKK